MSESETARLLKVRWETVTNKAVLIGVCAKIWQRRELARRTREARITAVQFDEMETFEHSKLKPLSLPLMVESKSRAILDICVASMPANGLLAKASRKKYGPRADDRAKVADRMFQEMQAFLSPDVEILSDKNPKYPKWIHARIPNAVHLTVKGRKSAVVGQGELKRGGWDPIFALNHTAAMFRANINRLFRKTWCTTKLAWKLELRLWMYVRKHNVAIGWNPA